MKFSLSFRLWPLVSWLLLAVVGMCMLRDQPGWQASVARLIDTLVDGLRTPG